MKDQHNSEKEEEGSGSGYIGTIDTNILPSKIFSSCSAFVEDICELRYGVRPKLVIEDHTKETIFRYIWSYYYEAIEGVRATIDADKNSERLHESQRNGGDGSLPPVIVTLPVSRREGRNGAQGKKVLSVRIRDRDGGIVPEVMPSIWILKGAGIPLPPPAPPLRSPHHRPQRPHLHPPHHTPTAISQTSPASSATTQTR